MEIFSEHLSQSILVGPAGWSYQDWQAAAYPTPRPQGFHEASYLAHYFPLIEINSSFYRPLRPELSHLWAKKVESIPQFQFTAKMYHVFTHERILNRDDVKRMVDETIKEFGRVDILINNAAYARAEDRTPILDLNEDTFQRVMDIKVTGTFLCTKAAIKPMIDQGEGGKIVNISSTAGKRGSANTLAYNGANFAIVGMTQSMAKELGPHNINVNAVCPGAVDTHRMDILGRGDTWSNMADTTPIGRNGTDEEVGDFCAYLCTEAASWIHGQSINQNGGTVMEH